MIELSADERRRAFSTWLRSGRLPSVRGVDGTELKFNPWHDPDTGRFTFVGAGQRHGRWGDGGGTGNGAGASGTHDGPGRPSRPKATYAPARAPAKGTARPAPPRTSARGTWTGGGFTGGGGGDFAGAGASGRWGSDETTRPAASSRRSAPVIAPSPRSDATGTVSPPHASPFSEPVRTVVRNGYTYEIDMRERTRRVSGTLTTAIAPSRSRTSQRQAGGAERRATDDGGHYIAARFNGPTEAFNHFAQNANVNRGRYRLLESEWAGNKRAGRAVVVKIIPYFSGKSVRPSAIDVSWTVDGRRSSAKLPN